MGLFDSLFGGGDNAPTVTSTNTIQLSPEQQQIADLAFPGVRRYANNPIDLWSGPTVAGFNANETAGQNAVINAATGAGNHLAELGLNAQNFMLNPAILSPDTNPFLRQQGDYITQTVTDNLMRNILPGIRRGAVMNGGAFSASTRPDIASGLAVGETGKHISGALSDLYNRSYQQGLSTMLGAQGLNPQVQAQQLFGGLTQAGVGAQQRAMEQAQLDAEITNFYLSQPGVLDFLRAQDLYSLIGSMPGATGVSTATGAVPEANPVAGGLGGMMTGFQLGNMIPIPGAGIVGGLLGGLAGAFG